MRNGNEFYLSDALGSIISLTDDTGIVATSYAYEPFGRAVRTGSPSTNPFQYTAREHDLTGLYYYRARYYHPQLARFINEDPHRLRGGDPNLYAYAKSNPLRQTDPFGLKPLDPCNGLGCEPAPPLDAGLPEGNPPILLAGVQMGTGKGVHEAGKLGAQAAESIKTGTEFAMLGGLIIVTGIAAGQPVVTVVGIGVATYGVAEFALGMYQLHLLGTIVGPR